jgi:hypothetical protein
MACGFRPIETDRWLESIFPRDGKSSFDLLQTNRFLYLEPITKAGHFLPVLTFKCDFTKSHLEVRLRLALFLLDSASKLRAVGYRFETPEGPGRHSYYHAQPITSFALDSSSQLPCPNWLSSDHPSFVLDAVDPVTLLVGLLVSLYGYTYFPTKVAVWLRGVSRYYSKKMHLRLP